MAGIQVDGIDWENMMNKELHDKVHQKLGQQVEDVMASFGKALERMDDIEKTMDTKLDAKFDELLKRLPQPPPRRDTVGEHNVSLLSQDKILVLLLLLLMLL